MSQTTTPAATMTPAAQTRAFSTVFLIEMWERFGYYGMAALLVLFMIDKIGFADDHARSEEHTSELQSPA